MRTLEECYNISQSKETKEKFGHAKNAIFDFIKYSNVHTDPLHERIRIPNKLISLVWFDLMKLDNKDSSDLNELPAQRTFINWLIKNIRANPFSTKGPDSPKSDPNIKLKTFNGSQSKKIYQLVAKEEFLNSRKSEKYANLLNDYWRIHIGYTKNFYIDKTNLFRIRVDKWKNDFRDLFHDKDFTIYMHDLEVHIPEDIERHGNLDLFNLQG